MKTLISLILIAFSLTAFSQNPPYKCGTYQQGGKLCSDGNLYPSGNCSGYYHPKLPQDYWVYVGDRNYSPNWYLLVCGETNVPLDDYVPFTIVFGALAGYVIIRRKKCTQLNFG